ncbi:hypothetical protein E4U42_006030 [Claviceps africana]|uniref:Uncharacterized protein n=1 Tax=Claviceps africana TaxID=83212 RepID=A0A8K0J8Y3_9HYPO|nr:hypothetical protein E4U42_006030 [Claviceps africana]
MKISTILGGVVLSSLEVYSVNASPLSDLTARAGDEQYCCVELIYRDHAASNYVLWKAEPVEVHNEPGCQIFIKQSSRKPSERGCADWEFDTNKCPKYETASITNGVVRPSDFCDNPALKYFTIHNP